MADYEITQHDPHDPLSYKFLEEIGVGVSKSTVHKATFRDSSHVVAIKVIRLERSKPNFETMTCTLLNHRNILRPHCLFTVNRSLWVVMPFISGGSLQSIVASSYPDGLPEAMIATVLKQVLTGLTYLHNSGYIHRGIKAGNILIDSITGAVKLADFGISAYARSPSSEIISAITSGTPYWMLPELIHGFSSDIWSVGMTALELAHGKSPLSPFSTEESLKMSEPFKDLIAMCLEHDPSKRPTVGRLLKQRFFNNCKGTDFLIENMQLHGVPAIELRPKGNNRLKRKSSCSDELEGDDECDDESSTSGEIVGGRRTSKWNFNLEGFYLVPVIPEYDEEEEEEEEEEEVEEEEEEEEDDRDDIIRAVAEATSESLIKSLDIVNKSIDEQMQKIKEARKRGDIYEQGEEEELTQKMLKEEVEKVEMEMEKLKLTKK